MSLFTEMARLTTLTAREAEIRTYILENPQDTVRLSCRELGKATYSSAATVNRFCKKLGCDGYMDFRMRLASELGAGAAGDAPHDARLASHHTVSEVRVIMRKLSHFAVAEVDCRLSAEKLERILAVLRANSGADLYSLDDAFSLTAYACRLLQHAGKDVVAYGPGEVQLDHALHAPAGRPAVFIARTGESMQLTSTARILREQQAPILAVVADPDSTLARLADECVTVPCALDDDPLAFCQFTTGVKYLWDLVYAALYVGAFQHNEGLSRECWFEAQKLWMLPRGKRSSG